jgi:hypothetical protein
MRSDPGHEFTIPGRFIVIEQRDFEKAVGRNSFQIRFVAGAAGTI